MSKYTNFDLRGFIAEGKKAENTNESAPGFAHDCAAHVVHETYGYGVCIAGQHTLVENTETGKHEVTHYDVFFKNEGIKKNIPVNELDIRTIEEHVHGKRKKNEESLGEEEVNELSADAIEAITGVIGAGGVIGASVVITKLMDKLKAGDFGDKGKAIAKYLEDHGKAAANAIHRHESVQKESKNSKLTKEEAFKKEIKNLLDS